MKNIFVFAALLCLTSAHAQLTSSAPWMEAFNDSNRETSATFQEIVDAFDAYWTDKDPEVKGSGYKPFKRWESLFANYQNPDGTIMTRNQLWDVWNEINSSRTAQTDDSDWISVGPLTHTNTGSWSSGQGRVNSFTVDPSDPNVWYAGAPAGGIWKSTDAGVNWIALADDLPQIGVSGIAVDPNDSNIIYIATGDDDGGDSDAVGVLKSTDGGNSWDFTGLNLNNSPSVLNEIYIDPSNSQRVFVGSSSGVFRTTNGGTNWTNVRSGNIRDIKLKPGDGSTIYASTNSQLFRSSDGGDSWQVASNGIPSGFSRTVMDVTPANPEVVYVFASNAGFSSGRIFKSTDSGVSFVETFNGSQDIFESSQAWFDFAFAVSDTNENEIYTGILNVWKSTNSGSSFTKVNNWNQPQGASYTHADIHRLGFINGRLFCASDGGLYSSTNNGTNFTDHTSGMAIGQFYRISLAKTNSDQIAGGLQDNGGYARNNEEWQNYYGADGMETAIDPTNPNRVYGFIQNGGGLYISNSAGGSLDENYNAPAGGNWITPLQFSKDNRLYAGYGRVYEFDVCNNSWNIVSPPFSTLIDVLETDPNNENIMYVGVNNRLYRSVNAGADFTQINSFSSNINSIEVNNGNSDLIYITTSGTTGDVFIGDFSGGNMVLTEITANLPNIPKLVVKHQGRHTENPLYLGTAVGVWRFDDTTAAWETFDNGLPNVPVRDLEIGLEDGKLTAATFGRGIWQTAILTQTPSSDLALIELNTSSGMNLACGPEDITATVLNNGSSAVTSFDIIYAAGTESNSVSWTGNLAPGTTTDVALSALPIDLGSYIFEAEVVLSTDQIEDNNTTAFILSVNEAGVASVINDFETDNDNLLVVQNAAFLTDCGIPAALWERGIPSGAVLNQAVSGQNVYGTNLDGNHPSNTLEYLTTACYDLSAISNPAISFQMAFELELDWDILYMEYSANGGVTWDLLGSSNDANWYNSNTLPGSNCFNCPGAQWTGTETQMQEYSYNLSAIANETNVVFRFVFHSDQSVNEEGVVIDDLKIGDSTLSTEAFTASDFKIFPNPSNGIFNITYPAGQAPALTIFDVTGKIVVKTVQLDSAETNYSLDLSAFSKGVYILESVTAQTKIIKKIILN